MPMGTNGSGAKAARSSSTQSVVTYQTHHQSPIPTSVLSMVVKNSPKNELFSSGFSRGTGRYLKRVSVTKRVQSIQMAKTKQSAQGRRTGE